MHQNPQHTSHQVPFTGPPLREWHFQTDYRITLEVISLLLRYPDATLHHTLTALGCAVYRDEAVKTFQTAGLVQDGSPSHVWVAQEAARILQASPGFAGISQGSRRSALAAATRYPRLVALTRTFAHAVAPLDLTAFQSAYVQAFDLNPLSSLHLSWHVYGDSPRQGRALAAFIELYHDAGFDPLPGELPDYLPLVLEFMAVGPEWASLCLCQQFGFTIAKLASRLDATLSPYAPLLHAVVEALDIPASPVPPMEKMETGDTEDTVDSYPHEVAQ